MPTIGSVEAVLGLDAPETCYNGIIYPIKDDHWYFVHRRNNAEKNGCGQDVLEGCVLDRSFSRLSPWTALEFPGYLWEDPRIYTKPLGLGMVVGGPGNDPLDWRRRRVYCVDIVPGPTGLQVRSSTLRCLRRLDKERDCEKNWLPFLANGKTHILYSVCPMIVLEVAETDDQAVWTKVAFKSDWGFDFPGSPCSCGTVPVKISETEFLSFFHSVEFPHLKYANSASRSLRALSHTRLYRMGACTFSAIPPFELLTATEEPIEYPDMFNVSNRRVTRDEKVVFPASANLVGPDVIVSIGENDSCTKIISFDLVELRKTLRPVRLGDWASVHNRPVPCDV